MSRIKIQLPEQFGFETTIPIRITDLNYGNHVGNDAILSLMHEARVQFLRHYDLSELDFAGVGLIMSDAGIEFKAELFYGDVVKAFVAAGDFTTAGFSIYYKLVNARTGGVAVTAKTGMVCFNYDQKKITALPAEAKAMLLSA